jgi:glycosyltransferase involved in cell wall biosynthesis
MTEDKIREQKEVRIQGVKVVSCVFDGSGYAQGARNWIMGMYNESVPIYIQPVSFERDKPDLGDQGALMDAMCRTPRPCDVNFVRLSPEVAVQFIDPNMVNICSCAWETSRLDKHWVDCCNKFDGVFVESDWLVGVFKDSGVHVPVYCVPNCMDASKYTLKEKPNLDSTYQFYSIMQWTERKNGLGLLKSYFNAFDPEKDDVRLVLKAYLTRVEIANDQIDKLKSDIEMLKRSMNMDRAFPPVYVISDKLTTEAIQKMHEECDCYIILDRGEGFGLPHFEAATAGNPVIATDWGGTRQFLTPENSYPISCQPTYVCNMEWSQFYRGNQLWAEPNLVHASDVMRHVYKNRQEAFDKGLLARQTIENDFNSEKITKRLLAAIATVVQGKRNG